MRKLMVLLLALLVAGPANAGWRMAETRHFRVFSEEGESSAIQRAALLEDFQSLLVTMTGRKLSADVPKLDVYLVRDVNLASPGSRMAPGVVGFYRATAGGIAAVAATGGLGSGVQSVLLHEVAHHFMFADATIAFPAWYIEGFAEYFQTAIFSPDRIDFGRPDEGRVRWLLYGSWIEPEALLDGSAARNRAAMFYAQSWLLTHWLFSTPERRDSLVAYLRRTAAGEDPVEAFRAEIEPNLRALNPRLQAYMRNRGQFHFRRVRRAPIAPADVTVTVLPQSADRLLLALFAIEQGVSSETGAALLGEIRAESARHGKDAFAQRVLAAAELFHGETAAAVKILDSLLEVTPTDSTLLRWRGLAALDQTRDPVAARRYFAQAFRSDPNDWRTLMAYVRTFPPESLDDDGLWVLERAWSLA
ncbi:MAG: hypothetical protein SNJ79_01180, partial [Sphingomonadaceae bacterium]